eukprot:scaffold90315_cov47-Phaeocystis_antarctica.AAC.3
MAGRGTSVSRGGREPDLRGMDMSCESGCRLGRHGHERRAVVAAWDAEVAHRAVIGGGVRLGGVCGDGLVSGGVRLSGQVAHLHRARG